MAATTYTLTASEQKVAQQYLNHLYRSQQWKQLVEFFLQADKEYGVTGANAGTNDALAPHSYDVATGIVSANAADTVGMHQMPFFK